MIAEYELLQEFNIQDLMTKVNYYIVQGWQPLGGVSSTSVKIDNDGHVNNDGFEHLHFTQAMVR